MTLIPIDSPNRICLSLRHPTTWRPTSTSTPVHLIPAGYLNTHQTFRCATLPSTYTPPWPLPLSPALLINETLEAPILNDPDVVDTTNLAHSTLPTWESLLLQDVRFSSDTDQIMQLLHSVYRSPGQQLFATVQHWYIDNTASFGWLLFSTTTFGPSPGPPSRSRADAWGILSLLRFLHHFPRSKNRITLILHRNPCLIRIMNARPNWSTVYCNETLKPDWDILEQSFASLNDLSIQITWQTLMDFKSQYHRPDYNPNFLFESRIDQLKEHTKTFLENYYQRIDYSPFLPSSLCMLISSTGTVHQNYHTAYRTAVTVPALRQYLCSKHSWTSSTLSGLNWQWFTKARSLYCHASSNHLTSFDKTPLQPTSDTGQTAETRRETLGTSNLSPLPIRFTGDL